MRWVIMGLLVAVGSAACQRSVPPAAAKSPVVLSLESPNAAGGGLGWSTIHVRNGSEVTIKAVRDFDQSEHKDQYRIAVRDADGRAVEQKYPLGGFPTPAPTEKDYVVLKPGEAGRLEFPPGAVVEAYALKPRRLYFIEVSIRFEGLAERVTLVAPYGYAAARKD